MLTGNCAPDSSITYSTDSSDLWQTDRQMDTDTRRQHIRAITAHEVIIQLTTKPNSVQCVSDFRTDSMDCLPILLSISVVYLFIFPFFPRVFTCWFLALWLHVSGTALCWPFNPHICFILFKLCFSLWIDEYNKQLSWLVSAFERTLK